MRSTDIFDPMSLPPDDRSADPDAIQFAPSTPSPDHAGAPATDGDAVHVRPDYVAATDGQTAGESTLTARQREAHTALAILRAHFDRMEQARRERRKYTVAVLVRARRHLAHVADLLRQAQIPYRSVEIETLAERQEVLDLLSLMRALMHPMDRIAWLSVLRAPWCGLGLADLHTLCGDEEKPVAGRPILQLLRERLELLPDASRVRAERVLTVMTAAARKRGRGALGASPTGFSLWIEQTWEALGGRACLDTEALVNVEVFFRMLAELAPDGLAAVDGTLEQRLDRLFAQPDPETDENSGIQLMTIHKAKGLEFDTVIVPGLERPAQADRPSLLCWMTRKTPGESGREVLLAPIGRKAASAENGSLYKWVRRQKERQAREEQQRLLYVACSRAKSELHLLGTAKTKQSPATDASPLQNPPAASLLGTLWPYAESHFVQRWQELQTSTIDAANGRGSGNMVPFPARPLEESPAAGRLERVAAEAESPRDERPFPRLRRLPAGWQWTAAGTDVSAERRARAGAAEPAPQERASEDRASFPRAPGSQGTRVRGVVVHLLLEQLSRQMGKSAVDGAHQNDPLLDQRWRGAGAALLRQYGMNRSTEAALLREIEQAVSSTLRDPIGRWLLASHKGARSESAWSSPGATLSPAGDGSVHAAQTVRADRVFLAGPKPGSAGESHLWIVDYKTAMPRAHQNVGVFLQWAWEQHQAQLTEYSRTLRQVYGNRPQRLGLYYPFLGKLDWRPAQDEKPEKREQPAQFVLW